MIDSQFQIFISMVILIAFTLGGVIGAKVSQRESITEGRNDGIVFCSEKPDQCKIEYNYLKLKETQK